MADALGIPEPVLSALRLGRLMTAEVPANAAGRRAWVSVHPHLDSQDAEAQGEGWARSTTERRFELRRTEYEAERVDGWDHDEGREVLDEVTVAGEAALVTTLHAWGVDPAELAPPWRTDWPE